MEALSLGLIWAGWVLQMEGGDATPEQLQATQEFVDYCPARQQDWVARYADGELASLGPVAGSGELRDEGEIKACLNAGLVVRPLPDGSLVRLRHIDPTAEVWEAKVLTVLNILAGESPSDCVTLRFSVAADGSLGAPELIGSSGDETFDKKVLDAIKTYEEPLPHVPAALRQHYGEAVVLCVSSRG